jgi:16S rRNA (uracil1498-N3)-methyltransferase
VTPADLATLREAAAHVVGDVDSVAIGEEEHHHLFRVLRLRGGEAVTMTDGAGRWRECRVERGTVVAVGDVWREESPVVPLTIAFAIPKRDRPEWIVQKLTEIGVDRIVLLDAERSIVRWDPDRAERHVSKLRKVAVEALQQCRGVWIPEIVGPVPAADVLPSAVAAEPGGRALDGTDRTIAVGPEGGWTPHELSVAADTIDLGDRVLRVETAAVVAAARARYHGT